MGVAARVLVFLLVAVSCDLLLGCTAIVSFAHTMFFGIGACRRLFVGIATLSLEVRASPSRAMFDVRHSRQARADIPSRV